MVEKEENEVEYSMAAVTRGDVVLSQKIPCVYEQVNEEELYFPVTGRQVDTVFVKKGDEVKKGDLLAQLVMDGEEKQQEYEYVVERNELLISQAKKKCQYDVDTLKLNYRTGIETPAGLTNDTNRLSFCDIKTDMIHTDFFPKIPGKLCGQIIYL